MRRSTAITLVLLGGGVVTTAVMLPSRCKDPLTGQSVACPGGGSGSSTWIGSHGWGGSGGGTTMASSSSSVSRGGFGGSGASASAGS